MRGGEGGEGGKQRGQMGAGESQPITPGSDASRDTAARDADPGGSSSQTTTVMDEKSAFQRPSF